MTSAAPPSPALPRRRPVTLLSRFIPFMFEFIQICQDFIAFLVDKIKIPSIGWICSQKIIVNNFAKRCAVKTSCLTTVSIHSWPENLIEIGHLSFIQFVVIADYFCTPVNNKTCFMCHFLSKNRKIDSSF